MLEAEFSEVGIARGGISNLTIPRYSEILQGHWRQWLVLVHCQDAVWQQKVLVYGLGETLEERIQPESEGSQVNRD